MGITRTPTAGPHLAAASTLLTLLVALTLTPANAHAQRSSSSHRDRLQIKATAHPSYPADDAVVSATGTVGRRGDVDATTLTIDLHVGEVIATALPASRDCPTRAPRPDARHTDSGGVYEARYSQGLVIINAFALARKLRLCAYLTAQRRGPDGVKTRTVARATTMASGSVTNDSSDVDADVGMIFGGVLAWIIAIGLIAAAGAVIRWLLTDHNRATAARQTPASATPHPTQTTAHALAPAAPPARSAGPPPSAQPAATPRDIAPAAHAEPRRRRAKPRDVIQDAVEALADTYRDRLQNILEHQDGPDWLHELNHRRDISMTQQGKRPPRPYESLEPRAVLNCLAHDPAGLQLISVPAAKSAKQLSGLVNDAHHPKPHAPLTEADGYRAWRLYADITGHVPVVDPFDR